MTVRRDEVISAQKLIIVTELMERERGGVVRWCFLCRSCELILVNVFTKTTTTIV